MRGLFNEETTSWSASPATPVPSLGRVSSPCGLLATALVKATALKRDVHGASVLLLS